MADQADKEKKIFVDEDWKTQVEREKELERARQGREEQTAADPYEQLPPPDLIFLATSLYLQGMVALGLIPNPMADNKHTVNLRQAQHVIDTLQMLQEKTEGNRTPEETEALENMLHELRMAFIGCAGPQT